MKQKRPIVKDRIRNIRQCTFGWVDHNFLHRGFLNRLSQEELLLYYFLITVADHNGVSFYDYERICQFLKLELDDYLTARNRLCQRSLIAFEEGVFQVLSLPAEREDKFKPNSQGDHRQMASGDFKALKDIFEHLNR